nr:S8 family serine peptidase [Actinomycetota bacterium]
MKRYAQKKFRLAVIACISTFMLVGTSAHSEALNLGTTSKYIISINPSARLAVEAAVIRAGGKIGTQYNYVFDGYVVELPSLIVSLVKKIPNILTLEPDQTAVGLDIQNYQTPTPSWGIDRVDQRGIVGGTGYVSSYGYRSAGGGATIYIGDTGIYPHSDFGTRLSSSGYSAISDGNGTVDCNGHGTHVASTAAGTSYGLAKNATLVPVRILNCSGSGTYSQVIAGLDWILSPLNPNSKSRAVLNLSIGGPTSAALNSAIEKLSNAGITVVAAAGNEGADACTRSPSGAPSAITVGATQSNDNSASFSNFGSCVDINAPGVGITGAWIGNKTATNTISGTSMASPHVTGAAAIYIGQTGASPSQVASYLISESTKDVVTGLKPNTVNRLLYVSPTDGGAPVVPPTVALNKISEITHESANFTIDVNPGFAPTTLGFEYSLDSTFASGVLTAPVNPDSVSGGVSTLATVALTGLTPLKNYSFRISAVNESGKTLSQVGSFTTLAAPATKPTPVATTATDVTAYSAVLNGTVMAGNATSTVTFMYSPDSTFATNVNSIAAAPFQFGGNTATPVSLPISFLDGGKTYYFKVVAINATATVQSSVASFTTPVAPGLPPVVTTNPVPTSRKYNSATFVGTVDPQSQTTKVNFIYGSEKSLTSGQKTITLPESPITGSSVVNVSATVTSGLLPGNGYYYQFVALNASGVTKGEIKYAILNRENPIIKNTYANSNTASSIILNSQFNAMGSNTRAYFTYGSDPALVAGTTV